MSDQDPAELLERNRKNLELGLVRARRIVNAMRAGNGPKARDATESLLFDHIRTLDDDAREQLTVNALTAAVQLQDMLTTAQAFGGSKGKR